MKNQIQLIITDMDGTLLSSDKSVSEQNMRTVQTIQKMGIPFTFCSGRPVFATQDYISRLQITEPVIGCNGAVIQKKHEIIFCKHFEPNTIQKLLEFTLPQKLDVLVYETDAVYYPEFSERVENFREYNRMAQKNGTPLIPLKSLEDHYAQIISGTKNIVKALFYSPQKDKMQTMYSYLKTEPAIYAVASMSSIIDMMPKGVSKGTAVKKLAEYYKIPLQNVLVIGDHDNDVPMFELAGFSACMCNGEENSKKAANYITQKNNNQNGFTEAILHFLPEIGEKIEKSR